MSERMLWNKDHTACVRASKIREICIYPDRCDVGASQKHTEVKGWYNTEEYFDFGWFGTQDWAEKFVIALNKQIET